MQNLLQHLEEGVLSEVSSYVPYGQLQLHMLDL